MDRDIFTEKMKTAGKPDMEAAKLLLKHSVDANLPDGNPRGHRNLIIVMEELAELGKEIAKELRGKGDFTAVYHIVYHSIKGDFATRHFKSNVKTFSYIQLFLNVR